MPPRTASDTGFEPAGTPSGAGGFDLSRWYRTHKAQALAGGAAAVGLLALYMRHRSSSSSSSSSLPPGTTQTQADTTATDLYNQLEPQIGMLASQIAALQGSGAVGGGGGGGGGSGSGQPVTTQPPGTQPTSPGPTSPKPAPPAPAPTGSPLVPVGSIGATPTYDAPALVSYASSLPPGSAQEALAANAAQFSQTVGAPVTLPTTLPAWADGSVATYEANA